MEDPREAKEMLKDECESPLKVKLAELKSVAGECFHSAREMSIKFQFVLQSPGKAIEEDAVKENEENLVNVLGNVIKEIKDTIGILRDTIDRSLI